MKMKCRAQISGLTVAVLFALTATQGLMFGPKVSAESGRDLEGVWLNKVKIVDCLTRTIVFDEFESMITYMHGGTLIEGGAPPSSGRPGDPVVSHDAGHGIWEPMGNRTFRVFFRSHGFNSDGRLVIILEVTTYPKLISGDNPNTSEVEPYYLSGEGSNRIQILDPDTGGVIAVTEGCNEATSQPILFVD